MRAWRRIAAGSAGAREVAEALAQLAPELLVTVAPSPTELAELAASRDHLAPAVPLLVHARPRR